MALEISNLGRRISGDIGFPRPQFNIGLEYYVDHSGGDNANHGRTWDYAVKTIAQAIALSNATVDWDNKKYNVIWVKPGVYAENLEGNISFVHIIGLGLRGTDTQSEIHPATGSVIRKGGEATCNLVGVHFANLHFEVDEAVPIFDIEIFNNSLIEDCTFQNNYNGAGAVGIDTDNCSHLTVRRCDFQTARTANPFSCAIYHRAGFAHNCRYEQNNIFAQVAGIWIEAACVNSQMVIKHNVIVVRVGGIPAGIGIDDNAGNSYCIDNWITALDAIDHAGGNAYLVANHVYTAGGGAVEVAGSD